MSKNKLTLFLILSFFIFTSCTKTVVYKDETTFANANWTFENKAVTFNVPLTRSEKPYAIILELDLTGTPNVDLMNATFSIFTPQGGKTIKPIVFNFLSPQEPYIKGASANEKIYRLTVYPKKYFSETGTYTIIVDQFSHKADNYGIRALRLRVEKVKEK